MSDRPEDAVTTDRAVDDIRRGLTEIADGAQRGEVVAVVCGYMFSDGSFAFADYAAGHVMMPLATVGLAEMTLRHAHLEAVHWNQRERALSRAWVERLQPEGDRHHEEVAERRKRFPRPEGKK